MRSVWPTRRFTPFLLLTVLWATTPVAAQVAPEGASGAARLAVSPPDTVVANLQRPLRDVPAELSEAVRPQLAVLGASEDAAFFDVRAGRWGTLVLVQPLLPGSGVGNDLTWSSLGREAPGTDQDLRDAAWSAFRAYLERFAGELRVDVREVEPAAVTVAEGGRLVQINARRSVDGVLVRDNLVTAVINSGNLILYGTRNWGTVTVSTRPTISKDQAAAAVLAYVASVRGERALGQPELVIVTLQNGDDPARVPVGEGYRYRLAWAVRVSFKADQGSWEALVDARSGELLSFRDLNQYADRKVVGGVFPVSNDGLAPAGVPDGIEQSGWPMPFADVATPGGGPFTDSGGNLSCVTAPIETELSGRFVRINDNCGPVSEAAAAGNLDLGVSTGTNCVVPTGHSAGDTHSARTGFFEVNRIKEMGRGWLPDNAWLQDQITANMNIDLECNAFWNGSSINFYRNLGACRNTGEIAAVFDHEWGHGMDANDSLPGISTPGEAPADMYAMLRLNDSCIGRGFFLSGTCGGNGDPCTVCTGVREADWAKRQSGLPHDIAWILRYPAPAPPGMPPGGCSVGTQVGPCGKETHCEGGMVTEVVWDLIHRDLAGPPFNMDVNTALNAVARLHYLGGGNVNSWFQCDPTGLTGGCGADSGYMQYLAVDDDNGSLADGTPHMSAIYGAFDRHQMACRVSGPGSPPVPPVNSGCLGAPALAPTATATAIDKGARVSWNAVPGAQKYWVFRTDGLHGCAFGKERVAVVTGTQLVDGGLMNGRPYVYTVEAVGANDTCRSAASACVSVTPAAGPSLRITASSVTYQGLTGDGDPFLDNCEHGRVSFAVENSGTGSQTGVRIVGVAPVSHPQIEITSSFPIPVSGSLASCAATNASFTLRAAGLAFDDTVRFRVDLASNQSPVVRSQIIELHNAESDLEAKSSQTFTFDSADLADREGWEIVHGTYTKTPGGAESSPFYLASSTAQNDACDQIRSPLVRLSATSTLSLYNQFSTEPPTPAFGGLFYDRANVGIFDVAEGTRTPISPSGGRLYNASGPHGTCGTEGQVGWASEVAPGQTGAGWEQSTWSPGALQVSTFAGRMARLDVSYGSDALVSGAGLWFDQVVLTNFDLQVPDRQSDECQPPACDVIDDSDHAVDYRNGWHRKTDAGASAGHYHLRVGAQHGGNASTPVARVSFHGDQITYFFAKSDKGGTADIYLGGVLVETLSYHSTDANPTFGHQRTYFTSGPGAHELRIEHRTGTVYVDGFGFACGGGGAQHGEAQFHSETEVSSASAGEGPIITRTVTVGPADRQISVLVEGSVVPLTVNLVDPTGMQIATGQALVSGLTASGLDKAVSTPGVYRVQVINAPGSFATLTISNARMVENP